MSSNEFEDAEIEWVWDPEDLDDSTESAAKGADSDARIRVKAWHIVFLAIAVLTTLGLAWWQWSRFQEGSGTFQNLGYALQWPLFGAFFIFAYRMILKYENAAIAARAKAQDPNFQYESGDVSIDAHGNRIITEIDEDFLPSRPSLDVEEFNALNQPVRGTGHPQRNNPTTTSERTS